MMDFQESEWPRPVQVRAARALLGLHGKQLAEDAKIGTATLNRFENDEGETPSATLEVVQKVRSALEQRGVVFLDGPDGLCGVIGRPEAQPVLAGEAPAAGAASADPGGRRPRGRHIGALWSLLLLANVGLVGSLGWQTMNQAPAPLYVISDDVHLEGILSPRAWAGDAVDKALSIDFANHATELKEAERRFTPAGWRKMQAMIDRLGLVDEVTKRMLVTDATAKRLITTAHGEFNGRTTWRMQGIVEVTYISSANNVRREIPVTLTLVKAPSANPGLANVLVIDDIAMTDTDRAI